MTQILNRSTQAEVTGYIVRAGTDPRPGSPDGFLGRFATEGEARQAFLALRLSPEYRHGWAELVAVGDDRTPRSLCWFGYRSPSGEPASPFHHTGPPAPLSRAAQVHNRGGTMQTKEQERAAALATELDRPARRRRSQAAAALVAVVAAATLAVGAAASRGGGTPSDRPVSTWQTVPAQPSDLPYYGSTADG